MSTAILQCPNCGRSVVPKPSGLCPSCQTLIAAVRGDADVAAADLFESYERKLAEISGRAESEIQRLANRSNSCGLWAFGMMLTVVLIPVSWVFAYQSVNAYASASSWANVMGIGEEHARRGRRGVWLSVLPILSLFLLVVRGLVGWPSM